MRDLAPRRSPACARRQAMGVIADPGEAHRAAPTRVGADRLQSARAPLEHAQLPHAELLEQLERALVVGARRPAGGGRRSRARPARPLRRTSARNARRRVHLAGGLAQAGGRQLDGDARLGDRLRRRARSSGADRPSGDAARGSLGGPQYLTRSGCAMMSNRPLRARLADRLEVAPPDLLGAVRRARPTRCSRPCRRRPRGGSARSRRRSRSRAPRSRFAIRSSAPGTKSASIPSRRSVCSRTNAQYSSRSSCA